MAAVYDVIVIGGGAGGLVVTAGAAQLGLKVALVEKGDRLGGDCLHYGCVPSKTLIHSAKVASLIRRAPEFGLEGREAPVDFARLTAHVHDVIAEIQKHDDPERFRGYGAEVFFGPARFVSPREVEVNGQRLAGRKFVLASGSRPLVPPVEGLEAAGYLTNETVFGLKRLPPSLLVMGGGPIGMELAQAFARFGARVTVVEMLDRILPSEDPEVCAALREVLQAEGIAIHTGTRAVRAKAGPRRKVLFCREGDRDLRFEADEILVAAGRAPNVEGLNLEAAGVAYGPTGVRVDARLRTTAKHIWACGDVAGPYLFTHAAEYQAGIVLRNVAFHLPARADYRAIPWATFTDPEVARVGLTAGEARQAGIPHEVLRFPFSQVDRALAEGEPRGFAKFVVARGRILGASIIGPRAGELIHEAVLVMQARLPFRRLSDAVHVYPTLAQVNRRTVNTYYGPRLFSPRARTLVRWIQKLLG
jgi:pyruvate/2-oxoglutarate dehydrogenase complex dihydrolipoamide dehydrogenase (E3) component